MSGTFEIFLGDDEEFYFHLKAGNGEIILNSEGYTTKEDCIKAVDSVRKNSIDLKRYELKTSSNGQFLFILKAANGKVIGLSELYKTQDGRNRGVQSVSKNAPGAQITDLLLDI